MIFYMMKCDFVESSPQNLGGAHYYNLHFTGEDVVVAGT